MANPVRSIAVRFLAEVGNYVQGVGRMKAATGDLITELSKSEQARQSFQRLGTTMLAAGAGIAAGIGLATRAAVQWESAWTSVAKTVDGTEAELAALEEDLRALARELPATHGEIAAVAAAAGQLGVATDDIAEFTRVMIGLGESTNLSADEAATAIAQLMNVLGTAPDDVDNLASALVELGNNGAATERQIVLMAQRIAGAGAIVGASEADVLALANALASVGIEVEAGGSAISRVLVDVATAVDSGGEKLETFATVAGVSSDEFAAAWRSDPVAALNLFIQGLGRMNDAGGDVFGTLEQLGFSEIRTRDALLRLSSAGDLLTASLDDGARAWRQNTALLEEVERRYGTTEARLQIARNQLNDLAIDIGAHVLPALAGVADTVGAIAELFGQLPAPVQAAVAIIGTLAAGVLLMAGAFFAAVPRIAATRAALDQLAASGGRAAAAVGLLRGATSATVGFLAGPWGAALALGAAVLGAYASEQAKAKRHADDLSEAIDQQTGAITQNAKLLVAQALAAEEWTFNAGTGQGVTLKFTDAIKDMNIELSTAVEAATGNAQAMADLETRLAAAKFAYKEGIDVTGEFADGTEEARVKARDQYHMLQLIIEAVTAEGGAVEEAADKVRVMAEATGTATDQMSQLEPQTRLTAEALGITAQSATELEEATDKLGEELDALFSSLFGVEEAQDAAVEAMRRMTEEALENGGALEGNSEAALQNRDNVREAIQADFDLVQAMAEAGASSDKLTAKSQELKDEFIAQAIEAGLSEEAVREYASAYDEVPSRVETTIAQSGVHGALTEIDNLVRAIGNIPRQVVINYSTSPVGPIFSPAIPRRHGGITEGPIIHAQHGVLRDPAIFSARRPARFAFAEPATGGEAFIPKFGDDRRSLAIADVAARWHGGRVVAGDGASLGGRWQWRGSRMTAGYGGGTVIQRQEVNVNAYSDTFSLQQVMDDLAFRGVV